MLGLMSGTSADGIDVCRVAFKERSAQTTETGFPSIEFELLNCLELPYSPEWKAQIEQAHLLPSIDRMALGKSYTRWLVDTLRSLDGPWLEAEGLGFHGPTLFHSVEKRYSEQLGDFQMLANGLKLPVVADFRTDDLLLGGRGAPLVPFGDATLFDQYDACVNLGGFANFSKREDGKRWASDSSICNYAMDRISRRLGKAYDHNGHWARSGSLLPDLLEQLEKEMLQFDAVALTREWAEQRILPLLENEKPEDLLNTLVTHCALQLRRHLKDCSHILLSGGGARNGFLVETIQQLLGVEVEVPDAQILSMKEALVFALLGWRKMRGEVNVLASATGAQHNHSAGKVYLPV